MVQKKHNQIICLLDDSAYAPDLEICTVTGLCLNEG